MKTEVTTVTVGIGDKEFSKTYNKQVFETVDDILSALQSDSKAAIAAFNYGWDLKAKSTVRAQILAESAGPEKAVNKVIADLIKARAAVGKPITEDQAKDLAKQMGLLD